MVYFQTDSILLPYEVGALGLFGLALLALPKRVWQQGHSAIRRVTHRVSRDGRSLLAASVLSGLLVFGCDLLFASFVRLPSASVQDEFAYLLTADTFAAGRLTNPTPPSPEHFESFHILTSPSYQGKYPPGQGVFLAVGRVLSGHFGLGVWLSHAAAATTLCWFLGGSLPVKWAFWGATMFALNDRVFLWWGQTYWGGAVAAIGGALLFGGLLRLLRRGRFVDGIAIGIGAGLLAISRPAEGLICCLCVLAGLAAQCVLRSNSSRAGFLRSAIVGGALGLTPFVAFMAAHNHAVTGNALRLPYQEWMDQYAIGLSGVDPNLKATADRSYFANFQLSFFAGEDYRFENWFLVWKFMFRLRPFYLPGLTLFALLGVRWPRRIGGWVIATAAITVTLFVLWNPAGGFPHYLAPVAAPILLGIVSGLRVAAHRFKLNGTRPGAASLILASCIAIGLLRLAIIWPHVEGVAGASIESAKQHIANLFEGAQTDGLVLIRYGSHHNPAQEYVYNGAQVQKPSRLGGPRIVWARSLDETQDRALMRAFPDRAAYVWVLDLPSEPPIEFEVFARRHPNYSAPRVPSTEDR